MFLFDNVLLHLEIGKQEGMMYGDFHFLNSRKVLPLKRKPLLWKGFSLVILSISLPEGIFLGSSLGEPGGTPGGIAHQI